MRTPPDVIALPVTNAASEAPSDATTQKTANSPVPHSASSAEPRMYRIIVPKKSDIGPECRN